MKLNLLPLAAVAGTLMLSACATDGYYAREDAYYPERDARYVDRYDERRYDDRRYDDRYARCFDCGRVERIEVHPAVPVYRKHDLPSAQGADGVRRREHRLVLDGRDDSAHRRAAGLAH